MQLETPTGGKARSNAAAGLVQLQFIANSPIVNCLGNQSHIAALRTPYCSAWPAVMGSNDGKSNREACPPAHLQHRAWPASHHRLQINQNIHRRGL